MKENDSLSRRNVLKSLGGASVGMMGLAGIASADETTVDRRERQRIRRLGKVRRVRREVRNPKVHTATKIIEKIDDTDITVYRFETDIGELRYVEYGPYELAQFIFGENAELRSYPNLPEKYTEMLTVDFGSIYTDMDGKINYIREATTAEKRGLEKATGVSPADATMVYSSSVDGFGVVEETRESTVVVPESGSSQSASTEAIANGSIREVTGFEACDEDACWKCVKYSLGGTTTCGTLCATIPLTTIPGIIACLACLAASGVGFGYFCSECLETCG